MIRVEIDVSMTDGGTPADALTVAQWVGESLNNPETRNRDAQIVVHRITVEESDA